MIVRICMHNSKTYNVSHCNTIKYKEYDGNNLTINQLHIASGTHVFDFKDLEIKFSKVCRDYSDKYEEGKAYKVLEFADEMLFKIGLACRRFQKGYIQEWTIWFHYDIGNEKVKTKVHVSNKPLFYAPISNNELKLTILQAELLAIQTFTRLNNSSKSSVLMTPLAREVFSGDVLPMLAADLKTTPYAVANIINSSCHEGGEHLDESKAHVAVIALMVTGRVGDRDRTEMVVKLKDVYFSKNKVFDEHEFRIYAYYSTGFPKELVEKIVREMLKPRSF